MDYFLSSALYHRCFYHCTVLCLHKKNTKRRRQSFYDFLHSFRINFKQSTFIWLIYLLLGLLMGSSGYILYHLHGSSAFWTVLFAIFIVAALLFTISLCYVFPLLAHFDNCTKSMLLNSLFIGICYILCSCMLILIQLGCFAFGIFIFTPFFLLGQGFVALLQSFLFSHLFATFEGALPNEKQTVL